MSCSCLGIITLVATLFLVQTADSAPASTIISLVESNLILWMDDQGGLNMNTSKGGTVRITSWTNKHLNVHYKGQSDNTVTLTSGKNMNCDLDNDSGAKIVDCNITESVKSQTTSVPATEGPYVLGKTDIIGIIVAAVLTAVIIFVVAYLIIRGKSKKDMLAERAEIVNETATANEAFNPHQHDQLDAPNPQALTTVVVHAPEPNGKGLSNSVEGLVSAPDTPTIERKDKETKTHSTYL